MLGSDGEDYTVGYKKPPKHTRYSKGRSGNPKGRPKGTSLSTMDIFKEEMEREITIKEENKTSRISLERATIRQLVHKAAKGDMSAMKLVLDMSSKISSVEDVINVPQMIIMPPDGPAPPEPPIYGEEEG